MCVPTFFLLALHPCCYRNIKRTSAGLLPRYRYAIKTNSRTIRSRLLEPTSAGKGRDQGTWVNGKPITAWHYNCEPDSCAVWVSYWQKTVIARIKSINRNLRCRLKAFHEIFGSYSQYPGGKRAFYPLRMAMRSLTILYQVPQTRPAHLVNRRNVLD